VQVTVTQDGVRIDASCVHKTHDFRIYQVQPGQTTKVTMRNLAENGAISFMPVYTDSQGNEEEPGAMVELDCDEVCVCFLV